VLSGDLNQTNNHAEVSVIIRQKFGGLGYLQWLFLVWLGSSLGELVLVYTIIFVGFLLTLSSYRRFKSPKPPPLPKTQAAKETGNTST
jgi:hypothetical protein